MDSALILAGLYNAAKPQGMGFLHYQADPMTVEEARKMLDDEGGVVHLDYLKGRVMKCTIDDNGVQSTRLYDRDNGDGTADCVLTSLETTGDPNNELIQMIHKGGLPDAIARARQLVGTSTTMDTLTMDTLVVNLGSDELSPHLEQALDQASK
jgi:hypothetical protein